MRTNDDCQHDFLDPEGFCIECGVHVTDRLSVPTLDDDDDFCDHGDTYEDEQTGATTCAFCGARRGADGFWYN